MASEYEKFQEHIFDELDELKGIDEQHLRDECVKWCLASRIDMRTAVGNPETMQELARRFLESRTER